MKEIQYFHAKFKPIPYEPKADGSSNEEGLRIAGFASTPTTDRKNDVVEPEAFRESITKEYSKNPIILRQHDQDRPIGVATHMSIDARGLYIKARIFDKDTEVKIKQGILRTFSIGYIPRKMRFEDEEGNELNPARDNVWGPNVKRILEKVDLVENSIVSVPANPDALFTMEKSVKSFFDNMEKAEINNKSNPITQKDMEKNLLEKKDEEVVEPQATPESTESAENAGENPEGVDVETPVTPTDETGGEEEGAEIVAEEGETPTEGEEAEPEVEEEAATEEVEAEAEAEVEAEAEESDESEEAEEAEAEATPKDEEKSLLGKIMTKDGARAALDAITVLKERVLELEAIVAENPTKRARAYFEGSVEKPEGNEVKAEADSKSQSAEAPKEKKGFIEALKNAAY